MSSTTKDVLGVIGIIIGVVLFGFFLYFMGKSINKLFATPRRAPHHQVAPLAPPRPYIVPALPATAPLAERERHPEVVHA